MNQETVNHIIQGLKQEYPDAMCSLDYRNEFELLISTRLAAQCTDKRVNIVTQTLFEKYKTLEDYANADIEELSEIVKPCGVYKVKAQNIKDMCAMLLKDYNGKMPDTLEELTKLPGVGRKTANLVLGDFFHKPAIVTDTHAIRISNLLGLVNTKDPKKVELQLAKIIPPEEQVNFCHRLVHHGRAVCVARRPKCEICTIHDYCKHYQERLSDAQK